jgi:glycosyltransferase involved in cell wall biosynthesis
VNAVGEPGTGPSIEVTVLMPCLNEADTVTTCVRKAVSAMARAGIHGEVLVADNGSSDGSQDLARGEGARVVPIEQRGYGAALAGGIEAATGRFVIMGDADDSYDFTDVPKFVERLREGFELVQGCRLPGGGGRVIPGAMPFSHRWLGNPMFTLLSRWMFGTPFHDVYCGMRGFSRDAVRSLGLKSQGMEFATEMLLRAARKGLSMSEVPIILHPDGRKAHAPHLRTVRDGWRTLRLYLFSSPRHLFTLPGLALVVVGLLGYGLAVPGVSLGAAHIDVHTLLVSSLAILIGIQAVFFGSLAAKRAREEGLAPPDSGARFLDRVSLEGYLVCGVALFVVGLSLLVYLFLKWQGGGFGSLDYPRTMRVAIPSVTLMSLGVQVVFAAFFRSVIER